MAGEEIGLAQLRRGIGIDAAGPHEAQRFGDAVSQFLVALEGGRILQGAESPFMDMLKVGIATLGKGAQQIEGCRRLAVGHDLAFGVGLAAFNRYFRIIDNVTAIDRVFNAIDHFGWRGARLGELPGNAAHFHHGLAAGKGHDHGHLKEDAEEIADVVGGMLGEAFGAIAALEQESPALGDARQFALQLARLTCKNQRRKASQALFHDAKFLGIGIVRHLHNGEFPPAIRCPIGQHSRNSRYKGMGLYTQFLRYSSLTAGGATDR